MIKNQIKKVIKNITNNSPQSSSNDPQSTGLKSLGFKGNLCNSSRGYQTRKVKNSQYSKQQYNTRRSVYIVDLVVSGVTAVDQELQFRLQSAIESHFFDLCTVCRTSFKTTLLQKTIKFNSNAISLLFQLIILCHCVVLYFFEGTFVLFPT